MRLTDVNIDRFGVWRDLDISLNPSGVNVFYGPNEAGKSTLMRFVRGVLYGFRPQLDNTGRAADSPEEARGGLRIIQDGREHVIRREGVSGERGRARFDELEWGAPSEARIRQIVRETTESVYENVFAIGLSELQELATLDADEVAEHIYGMSLGPEGERILQARSAFETQRQRLLTDDRHAGELVRLAGRMEAIDRELADIGDVSQKHHLLKSEQERLTAEIDRGQKRRSDREHDLRGHRFLERVHAPWKRVRQLRADCDALTLPHGFPEDGLARFDQLERELKEQQARHDGLLREVDRIEDEADQAAGDSEYFQHECVIRRLSDARDEMRHRERRLHEKQSRTQALEQKLQARLGELGGGWSLDRLARQALPSNGIDRLWDAARHYQAAAARRRGTVRRYKKAVSSAQKRQAEFNERLKSLGGMSLSDAIRTAQHRLSDLRELSRLRIEEMRLTAQAVAARGRIAIRSEIRELPPLFYAMMWFFAGAGLVLAAVGLWGASSGMVAGGNTAMISGLIYFCFGVCMAGASWTVKQHLDQYYEAPPVSSVEGSLVTQSPDRRESQISQSLARVRQSIKDLVGTTESPAVLRVADLASDPPGEIDESDVVVRTAQRLADLLSLQREERRIQNRRHRLSRYRELLRGRQRLVTQRRRDWCDLLRELGIGETLKVEQALRMWQTAGDTQHLRRAVALMQDDVAAEQRSTDELRRLIDRLIGELPQDAVSGLKSDPDQIIVRWTRQAHKSDGSQDKRAGLRRAARDKRREAETIEATLRDLSARRSALLMQTGVSSREELLMRMQSLSRHRELTRLLGEAQAELRAVAETEPDLAIIEEDLLAFNAGANRHAIERVEAELRQIDQELQAAHQELGRVKRELQELAGDRRAVTLRFEREQLAAELTREMESWCALDLSIEAVDQIRHRMERYGQSQTLQLASQYLDRLTGGKYPNVWSPLGERHLCIDDDAEQTLRIEQLSTGTREQLFLAIRLAMIRRFAAEGIELPMVLDDVFVNFDQLRTEAAVDTILDFAEQGQQIMLFTCHLHLAHLFEAKGIEPVWLPVNAVAVEKRRAG
ncbi:MAG: AAA family ATPase [Planctomycetaceae bacterium]